MQNFFETLNASLESENLLEAWELHYSPIGYNTTKSWTWDDGSKNGHFVSIYRNEIGQYKRAVHYKR
jgi:hypothetical protein